MQHRHIRPGFCRGLLRGGEFDSYRFVDTNGRTGRGVRLGGLFELPVRRWGSPQLPEQQSVDVADVIAMSEHVDYWNQLGWSDPFSAPQFAARQNQYARAFRHAEVNTPQMVVDGQAEFVLLPHRYRSAGLDSRLDAASDPAKVFLFLPERKPAEERQTLFSFSLPW